MPGKLKVDIRETECEIACTNYEGMRPSEYVELAATLTTLAAERSGANVNDVMKMIRRRALYMHDKNKLDIMNKRE